MLRGEMNEMDAEMDVEMDAVNCFHLFSDGFYSQFFYFKYENIYVILLCCLCLMLL